jgi:SpoVA protein.
VLITGFANSIVSPAMEFSAEGEILATGAKLFSLIGQVIAYGMLAAFIFGIIWYCFKLY